MSMTAAFPDPTPLMRVTVQSEIEEIFTRIQMYHCSMKAKLKSTCPVMFRAITAASRRILDLLIVNIFPASSLAKST